MTPAVCVYHDRREHEEGCITLHCVSVILFFNLLMFTAQPVLCGNTLAAPAGVDSVMPLSGPAAGSSDFDIDHLTISDLRGKKVLIMGGAGFAGSELVKRIHEENVKNFYDYFTSRNVFPDIDNDKLRSIFLREGGAIIIRVANDDEYAHRERIEAIMNHPFNQGSENLFIAKSKDILEVKQYLIRDAHKDGKLPDVIIDVSHSVAQQEEITDEKPAKTFTYIARTALLISTMKELDIHYVLQLFPYIPKKDTVCRYAFTQQQLLIDEARKKEPDNKKSLRIGALAELFNAGVAEGIKTAPASGVKKWLEESNISYFLFGLSISDMEEQVKKNICFRLLRYVIKKDFHEDTDAIFPDTFDFDEDAVFSFMNRILEIEGKIFSPDSYIYMVGYLFDDKDQREKLAEKIERHWQKGQKSNDIRHSHSEHSYHPASHGTVAYNVQQDHVALVYKGTNPQYMNMPRISFIDPKNWDVPKEKLHNLNIMTNKIHAAIERLKQTYKTQQSILAGFDGFLSSANREALEALKRNIADKIKILEEYLTILNLETENPFVICDLQKKVMRIMHIGRTSYVLYIPSKYIEKTDNIDELAAWISYGVGWLSVYHGYEENGISVLYDEELVIDIKNKNIKIEMLDTMVRSVRAPENVKGAIQQYANHFYESGKTSLKVSRDMLQRRFMSLIKEYLIAKTHIYHDLFQDVTCAFDQKRAFINKYRDASVSFNTQVFTGEGSPISKKLFSLAELASAIDNWRLARWVYPEWLSINNFLFAGDKGLFPSIMLREELIFFMRWNMYDECIDCFKQLFLGEGVRCFVEREGKREVIKIDVQNISDDMVAMVGIHAVQNAAEQWKFCIRQWYPFLDKFKEEVHYTCMSQRNITSKHVIADIKAIDDFEENIMAMVAFVKERVAQMENSIDADLYPRFHVKDSLIANQVNGSP